MKKTAALLVISLTLMTLVLAGCATIGRENNGTFDNVWVPAHDFTSAGLVFTEAQIENNKGEIFTYNALLKEAQKAGADAIINVAIDVKREGTKFLWMYLNPKETWYGSALAIKYTNAVKDVTTTTNEGETIVKEGVVMGAGYRGSTSISISSNPTQPPRAKLFGIIPLPRFLVK
ncbi:MAG: hypothetical protein LBQ55_00735 [Treponema sp.]|jgi:hypothetical protein|nr:hypothetical protein [Treponema sp.]